MKAPRRERALDLRGQYRNVIIACEGARTEHGYFSALAPALRRARVKLNVIPAKGTAPMNVVTAAVRTRDRFPSWRGGYDWVWAVFDGDEHRNQSPKNWEAAIRTARDAGIGLAISNPSFELWYLLHFEERCPYMDAAGAEKRLRRFLPSYRKSDVLFPDPLEPFTQDAIVRAERLALLAVENGLGEYGNPTTGVGRLVQVLMELRAQEN